MGLDLVEYTFALEDAFGIVIPDAEAQRLRTARHVEEYFVNRLSPAESDRCLEQRAFYILRRAVVHVLGIPRQTVTPNTEWRSVLPKSHARHSFKLVQLASTLSWPKTLFGYPLDRTIGATAAWFAARRPSTLKPPGEGWSRTEIRHVIRHLSAEELGIPDIPWDAEFVKDLKLG